MYLQIRPDRLRRLGGASTSSRLRSCDSRGGSVVCGWSRLNPLRNLFLDPRNGVGAQFSAFRKCSRALKPIDPAAREARQGQHLIQLDRRPLATAWQSGVDRTLA